ncbi:hypothetical protein [Methylobacter sp.]|uniref:hypothetical protein n=1 Tax=Methylobacter sp. TaxID=2051955 RepID=UPI003DA40898
MKHLNQLITALFFLLSYSVASFAGESLNIPESKGMNRTDGMMGGMTEEQKDLYMRTFHDYMLLMKNPAQKEHLKKQQLDQLNAQHDHDGASPGSYGGASPSKEKKSSCRS